jgi:hypothetical protein
MAQGALSSLNRIQHVHWPVFLLRAPPSDPLTKVGYGAGRPLVVLMLAVERLTQLHYTSMSIMS